MAMPTPADVARFLGRETDTASVTLATEHLPLVATFVKAYTRDGGFTGSEPNDDVVAVIVSATARLVVNPAQLVREEADSYSAVGSFNGFSLPELAVLHRYRRRAC